MSDDTFTSDMIASTAASLEAQSSPAPAADSHSAETGTPAVSDAAPIAQTTAPVTTGETGPIPFDRHKAILEKERTERQQLAQQYEQAQQQVQSMQGLVEWQRRLNADPTGTVLQLLDELSTHPHHAAAMRSHAGRMLSAARRVSGEPAPEDAEPPPDFQDTQGNAFYSATQQKAWMEWNQRRTEQKFAEQLQPVQEFVQQQAAHASLAQMQQQAITSATQTLAQWRQYPGFREHEQAIKEVYAQTRDLGAAYAAVVGPKLAQQGRDSALADLRAKATAGSVHPSAPSLSAQPSTSKRSGSFFDPGVDELIRRKFSEVTA